MYAHVSMQLNKRALLTCIEEMQKVILPLEGVQVSVDISQALHGSVGRSESKILRGP